MEGGGSGPPDRASLLSVCGPGSPPSFILIFHTNNSCCPLSLRGDNDKVPGPKKSKSTVRDSQLLVRCIPLRSEQQCCSRPAVAGGHFSSVSRRAARQVSSAWSPRALERAGGQKQACGSCAQLPLRCERLQPAMRPPKLPYFLAAAPVVHLHGHSPENETGARLQVGSAVARLPLQRLSPAPSGCCMANVVAPDFATATTFICMVSSPDVAALNLFASALLDFDFVLLLLAAS